MLHNLTSNLAILANVVTELLWQSHLLIIAVFSFDDVQVDARAFVREDFRFHTMLAKVDLCPINLIHQDRWKRFEDLKCEV